MRCRAWRRCWSGRWRRCWASRCRCRPTRTAWACCRAWSRSRPTASWPWRAPPRPPAPLRRRPTPGRAARPDALGARTSLRSGRRACLWPLAGQQVVLAGRTGQRAPRPVAAGRAPPAGAERRRRRAGGPQRGAGAHRPGALAAAARAPDRALRLGPGRRRARGRRRATRAARGCAADGAAALVRRAPPTARGRAAHAHALRVSWDSRRPPRSPAPGGRCADRARAGPADGALRARAQAS